MSESIALITTANTVAQDSVAVGQGLKTASLRIRSTKADLEAMGEDAEGAAESTSKLRKELLSLTGVDIQIDENTYKSTYNILLEISKVWRNLTDLQRSTVLEDLFGKRQANIGAAILENGDLLQQVYDTAENSIGSAAKEQERFSQSIQYSINSFKAAYQSLASDVVGSKFVKEIVDLGSVIVKGLDFIITKTGILQGILVGFGSLAIFKTIPAIINQVKTLGTSLAAFGTIMNTLGASGSGGQLLTLEQLSIASKSLSDRQFELVLSTKNLSNAQLEAMMTARGFTQEQIQAQLAIRNQTTATNGLTVAEKGASASTFTLSGALKGLGAAIAANPIGAIVTAITLLGVGISSLKRKHQEAIVEAKRLEEERINNLETTTNELKAFESEQDSIDGITKKYVALLNTTSDIASAKESLTGITNELNERFGDEKSQIDLVNGSLSENIELIREQQLELDKQWQRDNKGNLEEASKFVSDNSANVIADYTVSGARLGSNYDEAVKEAEFYFKRMKHLIDENDADLWNYLDVVEEVSTDKAGYMVKSYGFKLKEGLDKNVIPDVLNSFRDLYEQLDKYSYMDFNWFKGTGDIDELNQFISDWEKYLEILNKNEDINNEFWDNTAIGVDGAKQKINSLIDAASELSRKINDKSALPADVYIFSRELDDIRDQLNELAKSSPELQKRLELVFSTIGLQAEDVSESADLLKKKFYDTLDETQKGVFDKVDKINDAITKMLSGEGLSATEAWELLDIDTTGILTPIIDANGEWIMQSEQLVALKERLIGLSREQVQADLQAAQSQVTELDKQIADQYAIIKKQQEIIARTGSNSKPNDDNVRALQNAKSKVNELLAVQKKYSDEITRDNYLLQQLNASLRHTVEQQEAALKAVKDYADNLLKAQEYKIDQIISGHEAEKDALEAEKQALQDELDVLNDQKDAIEEIIENYDTVNNYIQKVVKDEIDAVKEQQKAIEDSYNKRIDALKAENEEREDALEYAEKLANLENAKRNKRYVLDETRGWRYESVKEDVVKAQNDLADFETSREIKVLEKERDKEVAVYDDIIDRKEKYLKQWEDIPNAIKDEQDELIAQELYGADIRERIANEDTDLLEDFDAAYRKHNTDLRIITGTEIKLKQAAIDAKDAEIKSKDEQIKKWKEYKTEVQNAAKEISTATEGYLGLLNTVTVDENSSLETRTTNLNNFKEAYSGALQTAIDLQNQLDSNGGSYEYDVHVNGLDELKQAAAAASVIAATAGMASTGVAALGVGGAMAIANSPIAQTTNDIVDVISEIMNKLNGYSQGGVADYTGMAMLHGRKNAPETIFNASDSAKLYDMVHNTPNLMADMLDKAVKISGFNLANTGNTNNTSTNLSFHIDKIVTDNPEDFAKQLDRYYQTKLTQNYTSRQ